MWLWAESTFLLVGSLDNFLTDQHCCRWKTCLPLIDDYHSQMKVGAMASTVSLASIRRGMRMGLGTRIGVKTGCGDVATLFVATRSISQCYLGHFDIRPHLERV